MAFNVFKDDSLVELLINDGTKITGIISSFGTNTISIRLDDGSIKDITQEMLSHVIYF